MASASEKWASLIGLQPVLILTDHKSLESWYHEISQDPMGPSGRRARWHQKLSRFKLEVVDIKGKDNTVADALSRWVYPVSQSFNNVSWHGSAQDQGEMEFIISQEKAEEKLCPAVFVNPSGHFIKFVFTGNEGPTNLQFSQQQVPQPDP